MIYMAQATDSAADQIATYIKSDVDQETNLVDRLARNSADNPDSNLAAWQIDAASLFDDAKDAGCVSIALVDVNGEKFTNRWVYPTKENVGLVGFDQGSDPRRHDALEMARDKNGPVISTGSEIGGKKNLGFVVLAPIGKAGRPNHFIAVEYLYARFFANVAKKTKLGYNLIVKIGRNSVYSSLLDDKGGKPFEDDRQFKGIFDTPVMLTVAPNSDKLATEKSYLPEMALAGGLLITLLLGFVLHLARRASSGQYLSELSNKRLVAENEERRRVEASTSAAYPTISPAKIP